MKYTIDNHRWGPYNRKLREDHVDLLYSLYKKYGFSTWRTDSDLLPEDRSKRQYFLERMFWTFKFIHKDRPSTDVISNYSRNQKQMVHYSITPKGLKVLIQLGYTVDDKDVAYVAREELRN
jgi:hypothetical protein